MTEKSVKMLWGSKELFSKLDLLYKAAAEFSDIKNALDDNWLRITHEDHLNWLGSQNYTLFYKGKKVAAAFNTIQRNVFGLIEQEGFSTEIYKNGAWTKSIDAIHRNAIKDYNDQKARIEGILRLA